MPVTVLFLSLVTSGIGFVLFTYGRKQSEIVYIVGGLAFMVYPYFAGSVLSMTGVGVALGAAIYFARQAGW